jgi:hypothetical protein
MLHKPQMESVIVLVMSVAAVGMTVAALVLPAPEPGLGAATPVARAATPVLPAITPVAPAAKPMTPAATPVTPAATPVTPAGAAMALTTPPAATPGPRMCALAAHRRHVGRDAGRRRAQPPHEAGGAEPDGAGGAGGGQGAVPSKAGAVERCGEPLHPDAEPLPAPCCQIVD